MYLNEITHKVMSNSDKTAQNNQINDSTHNMTWGDDGFNFSDVMDIVNPINHLPIISDAYNSQSDSKISNGSKIVGGAIFGGLLGGVTGVAFSLINSVIRNETQKDVSEHLVNLTKSHVSKSNDLKEPENANSSYSLASNRIDNPFFHDTVNDYADSSADLKKQKKWGTV